MFTVTDDPKAAIIAFCRFTAPHGKVIRRRIWAVKGKAGSLSGQVHYGGQAYNVSQGADSIVFEIKGKPVSIPEGRGRGTDEDGATPRKAARKVASKKTTSKKAPTKKAAAKKTGNGKGANGKGNGARAAA